jgi:Na+-transporting NADH:ubiquinone oxidoreductase subunit C
MKKHLFSIFYMFLVTLFFTSMVSGVKLLNEDRIERNQEIKLQRIILKVLKIPLKEDAANEEVARIFQERVQTITATEKTIYVGTEEDGEKIQGYAFPVGGPGFWGPISGMVAVDPLAAKIIGIAFYKHSETPGLGGRITETWFTDQFVGLTLHPVEEGGKIFFLRPSGTGSAPNELDAVTGATGTSRAVEAFLNLDLDHFLKKLWQEIKEG